MKKSILALGLAFIAFTLTSCSKSEEFDVTEVVKPTFELFANINTRTANDGLSTTWVKGDEIGVFHAEAGTISYKFDENFTTDASGLFKGSLKEVLDPNKRYDWYSIYPYNSKLETPDDTSKCYMAIGCQKGQFQTQTGNNSMEHLSGAACLLVGVEKSVEATVTPSITMNHATTVARFTVTNSLDKDITVTKICLTAPEAIIGTYYINFVKYPEITYTSSGNNYVSDTAILNVEDGDAIAPKSKGEFYVAFKPFTLKANDALKLSVTAKVGDNEHLDEATITLAKDVQFEAGHIKNFNVNFDTNTAAQIKPISVKDFIAKETSATVWYQLTGTITNLTNATYGNFDLVDETGSIYVYGLTKTKADTNNQSFASLGLKEGDIVTLIGTRDDYNGPQVGGPAYYVTHVASCAAPVIDCEDNIVTITAEEGATIYYTTNGDTPTTSSTQYDAPFSISADCTVKAFATADGKPQSVVAEKLCTYRGSNDPVIEEATLTFDNKSKRTEYSTSIQKWEENSIIFTNNKASSTNNVADYANPARLYAGSNITIEAPGNITTIKFVCNNSTYATALKNSIGTSATASGSNVTIALDGSSNTFTVAKLTAQVRLNSVTVSYQSTESGGEVVSKKDQTLAFDPSEVTATIGEEFTLPTLSGAMTTVTYSSNDTAVATVDASTGAVELIAAGITTITATAAGNEEYNEATASYKLTVVDPSIKTTDATLSFASTNQRTSLSTTKQVWQQNGITLTNDKGSSTSNVGDYANPARFYKSSKITVEAPGNITAIKFVCNNSTYATVLKSSIGESATANGSNVTVILNGSSKTFTIAALSGAVRMNSLTVSYVSTGDVVIPENQALKFDKTEVTATIGETFTPPTLSGAMTTVTYYSDNTSVAMVDASTGAVELIAVGTTTITATAESNENYYGGSASYTLTVEEKQTPVNETYTLLTNISELSVGDKIVIAAKDYNYAISTTQKSNNRDQASITKSDNTITFGSDVEIFDVEAGSVDGTFAFKASVGSSKGYIYAASSSSNYLKTQTNKDNNSSWKITVATNGTATIVAQGSNTRKYLQYNQSSALFACYASASQKAVVIYKMSK